MKFLKKISWSEVFAGWHQREANNPGWIECATKIKGWPDWQSWRLNTAKQFNAENLDWNLYQFENPENEIPDILIGPYSGWQAKVEKKNKTTFEELLNLPGQYETWLNHQGVMVIHNNLPFPTELIGLIRKDTNKIVLIDGHHRAMAWAIAKKQQKHISPPTSMPITIALTELSINECNLLDIVLEKGSNKQ